MKKILNVTVLLLMVLSLVGCLGLLGEIAKGSDAMFFAEKVMAAVVKDKSKDKIADSNVSLKEYKVEYDGKTISVTGTLHINSDKDFDKINFTNITPALATGVTSIKYDMVPKNQDLNLWINGKKIVIPAGSY